MKFKNIKPLCSRKNTHILTDESCCREVRRGSNPLPRQASGGGGANFRRGGGNFSEAQKLPNLG